MRAAKAGGLTKMAFEDMETGRRAPDPGQAEPKERHPISLNAILLAAVCLGLGAAFSLMPQPPAFLTFLFIAATWVLTVVVHEFGHAYVAHKAGDTTVATNGYLSLDPLKYVDLYSTILLPLLVLTLGGVGFPGAAVYLRPDLMHSRLGRSLSSLAGPIGTLVVLLALAGALAVMPGKSDPLFEALAFLAFLQGTALILNLLPIPGLDGYGVLRPYLPEQVQKAMRPVEAFAFIAIIALIFFVPVAGDIFFGVVALLVGALGIPFDAVGAGWETFRFWR